MKRIANFHESYRREEVVRGSERSFGFVIAGALVVIGLVPLIHGREPRWILFPIAIAFALLALIAPALLWPLNLIWHRFGLLLQKIVNPVVMGAIFAIGIIPTGFVLRLTGKDPMRRKFDPQAETYWIARNPPGPPPATMKNQF
jgi:uncharacterized membrane protein